MIKTSVKWDPDYWQDQGLPSSGCFGYVNGHLILGKGHHQLIMARLISAGWTWEQLMEAEQAWGWYNLENVQYYDGYFDLDKMKDWQKYSYFVHVMFTSDAGYQNEDAKRGALGAFATMYHLPAREDKSYGSYGVEKGMNKEYGSGLKGLQNADKYLADPKKYFENQKKLFQNVPQPPDQDWDPNWEENQKQYNVVEPEPPKQTPAEVPHVVPSVVPPSVEEWYPALEKQYGENPLNGIYFTSGSNWLLYTNGHATWYNNNGNLETPTSPVSHATMQGWINDKKIDRVGPKTFGGYEGIYVNSQQPTTSNHLHVDSDSATWKHPVTGDIVGQSVLSPESIKQHIDNGKLIKAPGSISVGEKFIYNDDANKENPTVYEVSEVTPNDISIVWPTMISHDGVSYDIDNFKEHFTKVAYTPGGKTKGWGDIMEKANYIRGNGGVQITSNEPQHVTGTVQSGTDPGNKGPYHTEIWRDDPQSQAITMWDCDCDWDQYAWGRTRQWKKYEGRPCCHVLALYWDALQNPPQGAAGAPAQPPTPIPGGGVTVNQGLIAPMGQPPMPNVPLIGPEGEPAPIGPEPEPAQPAWSEVVQPGKEEGTITFPGTFSHWKEAKEEVAYDRPELRFIVPHDLADEVMHRVEGKRSHYRCRTLYLEGGDEPPRLREYNGNGKWFIEHKERQGEDVTKFRWEIGKLHKIPAHEGETTYHRETVENDEVRITKDTHLKSGKKTLRHYSILEIKGDKLPKELEEILPKEAKDFSKRKWSTGEFKIKDYVKKKIYNGHNGARNAVWHKFIYNPKTKDLDVWGVNAYGDPHHDPKSEKSNVEGHIYSDGTIHFHGGRPNEDPAKMRRKDINKAKPVVEEWVKDHLDVKPHYDKFTKSSAVVNIPTSSREELTKFWHKHPDLRAECKKKYGFDPVDEADGYWPHGLGDEPEHHKIWNAVKDGGPFTPELVNLWEEQELAAAKKESSAAPEPPHYRKSDKPNEKCGLCKMFFEGKCWGYGNKPVEKDMVCDSFSPETKKEAAGYPWEEYENWTPGHAEEHADRRYIKTHDGKYYYGEDPHSMIIGEHDINPMDIEDAGYVMPDGSYYSLVNHNGYTPFINNPSYKPYKHSGWLEELRAMPNSFKNGDIVRVWDDTPGEVQEAYGQPGYPTLITKNMSGEVLSSNPESTVAIFPLKTGPLEHHLVRVEAPTSNFYLDNTNAQPFVKKH